MPSPSQDPIASRGRQPASQRLLEWLLLLCVACTGLYFRIRALRSPVLFLNGDQVVTGIAADFIGRGHLPVVVPGNVYGGTTEAYLFAAVSWLPFDRALVLRAVSVALWAVAAFLTGAAAGKLAGRLAGLVAGSLIWISGGAMTILSTQAYMGYPSGLAFVAGCFLLAIHYLDTEASTGTWDRRLALYGFLAGLALWSHPMFISTLGPLTLAVAVLGFLRHRTSPLLMAGGGALALLPYLVWNAANSWPILEPQPSPVASTYLTRVRILVTQMSPRGLGLRSFGGRWSWGTGGRVLFFAFAAMGVIGAITLLTSRKPSSIPLVAAAVLILPIMGLFEPLVFFIDGRYFVNVLVAWALLTGVAANTLLARAPGGRAVLIVLIPVLGVLTNLRFLDNTIGEQWGDSEAPVRAVIAELDRRDIRAVSGSYWSVGRIAFESDQRIAAESIYPVERFPRLARIAREQPVERRAVVFQADDERIDLLPLPAERYERQVFSNLVVYLPR